MRPAICVFATVLAIIVGACGTSAGSSDSGPLITPGVPSAPERVQPRRHRRPHRCRRLTAWRLPGATVRRTAIRDRLSAAGHPRSGGYQPSWSQRDGHRRGSRDVVGRSRDGRRRARRRGRLVIWHRQQHQDRDRGRDHAPRRPREASAVGPGVGTPPPDFTVDTNGATIGNLLAMESGIPDPALDNIDYAADPMRDWSVREVLATVPGGRSKPGDHFVLDLGPTIDRSALRAASSCGNTRPKRDVGRQMAVTWRDRPHDQPQVAHPVGVVVGVSRVVFSPARAHYFPSTRPTNGRVWNDPGRGAVGSEADAIPHRDRT